MHCNRKGTWWNFIRGFHHVPFLLQCVYYALFLSNFSIISRIYRQVLVLRICRNSRPRPLWEIRVRRTWFIFRGFILQKFSSTKNPALPPWFSSTATAKLIQFHQFLFTIQAISKAFTSDPTMGAWTPCLRTQNLSPKGEDASVFEEGHLVFIAKYFFS